MGISLGGNSLNNIFSRGRAQYPGGSPNPTGVQGQRPQGNVSNNVSAGGNGYNLNNPPRPAPAPVQNSPRPQGSIRGGAPVGGNFTTGQEQLAPRQSTPVDGYGMSPDQRAQSAGTLAGVSQLPGITPPGAPVLDSGSQAAIDTAKNNLSTMLEQLNAQKTAAFGRLDTDKNVAESRLNRNKELALDSLRQSLANRGILHSGINAEEQFKTQEGFSNSLTDIENQVLRSKNQMTGQFNEQVAGILGNLGDLAGTEAGLLTDIGLGNAQTYADNRANQNQQVRDISAGATTPLQAPVGDINTREGLELAIADMFNKSGINIGTQTRSREQRLADIAKDILSGTRTMDGVQTSINSIASGKVNNG